MRLLLLAALAALLPTAVGAQDLRRDVGEFERIGDCKPRIEIQRERGEVTAFVVHSQFFHALGIAMTLEECGAEAQARIARRHGPPDITTPGMDALGESFTEHVWLETVGVIQLRRYGDEPGDKWTIRYEPASRSAAVPPPTPTPAPAPNPTRPATSATDAFVDLGRVLRRVRMTDEDGLVRFYRLDGRTCAPRLVMVYSTGEPGPEMPLPLRGGAARGYLDADRYPTVEISSPGADVFTFSVQSLAQAEEVAASINVLIRACGG